VKLYESSMTFLIYPYLTGKEIVCDKCISLLRQHIKSLVGITLLVAVTVLIVTDVQITMLKSLQQNSIYKQVSGLVVLLYIYLQWQLYFLRYNRTGQLYAKFKAWHLSSSVVIPVILFLHTSSGGYAYQSLLLVIFLVQCGMGYVCPHWIKKSNKLYFTLWTILHVTFAVCITILAMYHFYITYAYK